MQVWASYGRSPRSCQDNCLESHPVDKVRSFANLPLCICGMHIQVGFRSFLAIEKRGCLLFLNLHEFGSIDSVLRIEQVNTVGVQLYPRDRWGRVHSCTMPNAYCASVGNPMFGQQHFDNIGGFVPATLQMAVPDSSYSIIHKALQSEPEVCCQKVQPISLHPSVNFRGIDSRTTFFQVAPIIWTIVMLITVFCTWLMLGLFVAVVTGTFERARERYRVTRNVAGRAFMDESADHEKTTTVLNEEVLHGNVSRF
jgi:hypothetical protein